MNNEELLNENAKLNAIIDSYQPKIQALKDEKDKYYQQTLDDEITLNELYQTLQEIKKYLKGHKLADEVRIKYILDLITKAEEE